MKPKAGYLFKEFEKGTTPNMTGISISNAKCHCCNKSFTCFSEELIEDDLGNYYCSQNCCNKRKFIVKGVDQFENEVVDNIEITKYKYKVNITFEKEYVNDEFLESEIEEIEKKFNLKIIGYRY